MSDPDDEKLKAFEAAFGQDYFAHTASSGMDAMAVLDKRTIQLVVTGRNLADMKGLDFLGKIVSLYPDSMRMILTDDEELLFLVFIDHYIVARHLHFLEPFLQHLEWQVGNRADGVPVIDEHLDDLQTRHIVLFVDAIAARSALWFDNLVATFPDAECFGWNICQTGYSTDAIDGMLIGVV